MDIMVTNAILHAEIVYTRKGVIDWTVHATMGVKTISKSWNVLVRKFQLFLHIYSKLSNNVSFFKHFEVSLVCEDGFYNSRCNSKCGKCVNNEPCDKVTGECRNGCHLHYKPPLCQGMCLWPIDPRTKVMVMWREWYL